MPKRRDLLERISADDPNYEFVRKFYHESWAGSHGLVADAIGGNVTLADFIDSCVNSVDQGARTHIAIQDTTPISARCRELDAMAKKAIRIVTKALTSESKRFGKAKTAVAIAEFSRNVNEITARSKQRIHEDALARCDSEQFASERDPKAIVVGPSRTVSEIHVALDAGDRKRAVRLRCQLDQCVIKELWSDAFAKRGGTDKTKRTAFNRWQAARHDTPSWADRLMRERLLHT